MKPRVWLLAALLLLTLAPVVVAAQSDALNLPADLYVLLNNGIIQRYGVGAGGVANITPDAEFVLDFGVAPDGQRLAYRTETGIYILPLPGALPAAGQLMDNLAGVPPLRGRGDTVAWSPPGDAIAYTTPGGARVYFLNAGTVTVLAQPGLLSLSWSPGGTFLAAEAEGNIWWIYRRVDTQLILTAAIPSSIGTTWISDTELVFAPADGGLIIMSLALANAQTPLLDASSEVRLPQLAPDGRLLFFRRVRTATDVPEGYGTLTALARGASQPETLGATPIDLGGNLRWTPGAGLMIAFEGGVLALFDPASGLGFPLPVSGAVGYGWGPYPPPALLLPPETTAQATFPDEFPTLDPATVIPGLALTPEATAAAGEQS